MDSSFEGRERVGKREVRDELSRRVGISLGGLCPLANVGQPGIHFKQRNDRFDLIFRR